MPDEFSIVLAERLEHGGSPLGVQPFDVRLSGEIDLRAMPELRRTLAAAVGRGGAGWTVDVTDVTFLSLSAMGAVLLARAAGSRAHGDVTLTGASRCFQSLMDHVDRVGLLGAPGGST